MRVKLFVALIVDAFIGYFKIALLIVVFSLFLSVVIVTLNKQGTILLESMQENEIKDYSTESGIVQSVTDVVGAGIFSDRVSQDIVVNKQKYILPSSFRHKLKKGETIEFEYNINTKNITSVKIGDIQ